MQFNKSNNLESDGDDLIPSLKKRYDELATYSRKLSGDIVLKLKEVEDTKNEIDKTIEQFDVQISGLNLLVDVANHMKQRVSSEFKSIVKIDTFNRLQQRVDKLPYEFLMFKKELNNRLL